MQNRCGSFSQGIGLFQCLLIHDYFFLSWFLFEHSPRNNWLYLRVYCWTFHCVLLICVSTVLTIPHCLADAIMSSKHCMIPFNLFSSFKINKDLLVPLRINYTVRLTEEKMLLVLWLQLAHSSRSTWDNSFLHSLELSNQWSWPLSSSKCFLLSLISFLFNHSPGPYIQY